jgi:hypothetical protein
VCVCVCVCVGTCVKRASVTCRPIPRIPSVYYVLLESVVPYIQRLNLGNVRFIQLTMFSLPISYLRKVKIKIHK